MRRSNVLRLCCGLAITAVLLATFLSFRVHGNQRVKILCYSHLKFIAYDLGYVLDDNRILPAASNLAVAFSQIASTMTDGERKRQSRLNFTGSETSLYCPSAYQRDGSVGYVYLGDGLRLGDVKSRNILIFFCSADSHEGWSPVWQDGYIQEHTSSEMVSLLRDAIRRGEEGDVSYSQRAMRVLRDELSKRLHSGE